ncbi:unnamed protein product [Cladocopium goreaui]|uniref:peptidylprolyl isomerase n=1 Tax=Cladocopium goreaui TaxID=2562237 RepID=A0A9P1C2K8_9DINO|nr:unnamed protein product [Cladocopium goreaui]
MARAVARLAERAAAKIQALFISVHVACCKGNFGRDHDTSLCLIVKVKLAKEKAREKLLGGCWLCSYCSVAAISKKRMEETIQTEVPEQPYCQEIAACKRRRGRLRNEIFGESIQVESKVTSLCRFRELDASISDYMEAVLRPACLLVQNLLPDYEVVIQNNDNGQSEEEGGIAPFVAQSMELIQVMASRPRLKSLLKNRVKNLIQLFAPFMRITEAQAAAWRSDPNEYLQQEEDDHFRGCMVRLSGEGLLSVMLESFKREASRSLANVVENVIQKGEAGRAAGDANAWKLTEVYSGGRPFEFPLLVASNVGADGDGRSLVLPLALFAGTGAAAGYVLYLEHLDESKVRGPALFPEEVSSPDNPRVWFDVSVNHRQVGRVECELFKQICPKTVENFRCLCTGEKGIGKLGRPLHYKECPIHRIMPGLICQGGDFVNGNGSGGESIYGTAFADEFERGVVLHSKPMLLSMANTGPDTNGSQFFITLSMEKM